MLGERGFWMSRPQTSLQSGIQSLTEQQRPWPNLAHQKAVALPWRDLSSP
jgi:hypothetical protein